MKDRVHFLDRIRWLNALLVVAFHCLIVYGSFDSGFYVRGKARPGADFLLELIEPWFMQLMFAVAGITAVHSLRRRGALGYLGDRLKRLLLPCVTGVLVFCPALTYFAERFHNGYSGGYFAQYPLFFAKFVWYDPRGYEGGFSLGQYWFILLLFVVSAVSVPALLVRLRVKAGGGARPRGPWPLLLGAPPYWFSGFFLALAGRPLPQYLLAFLAGALLLSGEEPQNEAVRWRYLSLAIFLAAFLLRWRDAAALRSTDSYYANLPGTLPALLYSMEHSAQGWFGMLAAFGFAKKYLNRSSTPFSERLSRFAFPLYYFHLVWVVAASYWLYGLALPVGVKVAAAAAFALAMSAGCSALASRIPALRVLMGVKASDTGKTIRIGEAIDEAANR